MATATGSAIAQKGMTLEEATKVQTNYFSGEALAKQIERAAGKVKDPRTARRFNSQEEIDARKETARRSAAKGLQAVCPGNSTLDPKVIQAIDTICRIQAVVPKK